MMVEGHSSYMHCLCKAENDFIFKRSEVSDGEVLGDNSAMYIRVT